MTDEETRRSAAISELSKNSGGKKWYEAWSTPAGQDLPLGLVARTKKTTAWTEDDRREMEEQRKMDNAPGLESCIK